MGKKGRGKSPNLIQKKYISGTGLNWKEWMVINETAEKLVVVSKATGHVRTIKKTARQ